MHPIEKDLEKLKEEGSILLDDYFLLKYHIEICDSLQKCLRFLRGMTINTDIDIDRVYSYESKLEWTERTIRILWRRVKELYRE